jgi:hypothetical protein
MTNYRLWWWGTVLAIGVPGATAGLVETPLPGVFFATTVLGIAIGRRLVAPHAGPWCHDVAVAVILLCAAGPAIGATTVALVPLAIATSPSVAEPVLGRRVTRHPSRAVLRPGRFASAPRRTQYAGRCLGESDGRVLCRMWSDSFVRLKQARTARQRAVAVALRVLILDELERRDGQAFAAWLARAPHPSDEPRWAVGARPMPRREE